jgi:hypothetical protein
MEVASLKRILACLFIMAVLPMLASSVHNNPAPFASVAIAGHSVGGDFACKCGCPNCICDPGETPTACVQTRNVNPGREGKDAIRDASPVGASGLDFGSSALMMALALLVWVRFMRT